jgi:hypothetical protein
VIIIASNQEKFSSISREIFIGLTNKVVANVSAKLANL